MSISLSSFDDNMQLETRMNDKLAYIEQLDVVKNLVVVREVVTSDRIDTSILLDFPV